MGVKTKLVNGIYLPHSDTHFKRHLEKGPIVEGKGTYQYSKIERALDLCRREGKLMRHAVDIGAHVGLWSRILAVHFDKVTAYEAHPDLAWIFLKNADMDKVRLVNVPLADTRRPLAIDYVADNSGNAHISPKSDGGMMAEPLDHFCLESVDFIKIDVEGFEKFVIQGGEQTIRDCRPVMVAEQKPGNGSRYGITDTAAIDLLTSWGMVVDSVKAGDYFMVWRD